MATKATTFTHGEWAASAQWFADLVNPQQRDALLARLLQGGKPQPIASRARVGDDAQGDGPDQYEQTAWLVGCRADAQTVLQGGPVTNGRPAFSNAPFAALGRGNFMLGMDAGPDHTVERRFATDCLVTSPQHQLALCTLSLRAAAVLPLKSRCFDAVALAEQAALRFVAFWFGFAQSDLPLLEACCRKATQALSYQTFARHFVTDPAVLPENTVAMGALTRRAAELIDLYRHRCTPQQQDEYRIIETELAEVHAFNPHDVFIPWPAPPDTAPPGVARPLAGFVPVLRRMACHGAGQPAKPALGTTDMAVIATGLIAGTVGNVTSAIALTLHRLLSEPALFARARTAAGKDFAAAGHRAAADTHLAPFIWEALRLDPPVAFLPRRSTMSQVLSGVALPADAEVVVLVGAATRDPARYGPTAATFDEARYDASGSGCDPLVFGGTPGRFLHQCLGDYVALPLVAHVVRQVLLLPGLAQVLNPRDGQPFGLSRQWGYHATAYPLEYRRCEWLRQSPLLLLLDLKPPMANSAAAIRQHLQARWPAVQAAMRAAGHIHFASFLLLEHDTRLALLAFVDVDLDDFQPGLADWLGPVLEPLLPHLRDAPPAPVSQHAQAFRTFIRHQRQAPAAGYLFSAYPNASVAMIRAAFGPRPARRNGTPHPLLVRMAVRTPVGLHADGLRRVIQYGAPRIEKMLRESRHVHFACFLFLQADHQLMLMTVFDRGFAPYVEHFALEVGALFDRLFEHIEGAPPKPVDAFPQDFVDTIWRYNLLPEGGFFSDQPNAEVAQLQRTFTRKAPQ